MKRFFFLSFFLSFGLYGQDYFIVNDGVKTKDYQYNVFTNANIYTDKGIINMGTLVEKDGVIVDLGSDISIPKNSIIFDLDGKFITHLLLKLIHHLELRNLREEALVEVLNMSHLGVVIIGMIIS